MEIFTFSVCYLLSTRHIINAADGFIGLFLFSKASQTDPSPHQLASSKGLGGPNLPIYDSL
jgi:hypothetical protein